ncbi:MAG: sn-glycerol-3-phosphate import ATP-binding protein UgpC [Candidatus Izimaplasma bacterium HR2]|nr:MAG: sn-glycerol-3-phosphate import ATP-binding protein UgpC [Candidatus Izimaplasma bacterium HR2]
MSYIKLENLRKVYNKTIEAVKRFDLEIDKGEFIVFLGPSGCGKSTTMRMIAGLETVTGGDIFIDGESIINLEPRDRGISMIFQSYAVWPHMTVFDNVAYALKLRKLPKEQIKKIVDEVAVICDIKEHLERYPSQLSGGQRQRVAVARAIAVKPKLFLMDEPLSNLDAKLRVSMRTDLKRIHQDLGSTSIFVTHDQSEALSLADRIVVMNQGVIEQIGTPNEIYHTPESMFVAQFIGSPPANFFDVTVLVKGDKVMLSAKSFEFSVKKELEKKLKEYDGKQIVLAARPENFTVDKTGLIETEIIIVEPQGSHIVINVEVDGKEIKVVTDKLDLQVGQKIKLGLTDKYIVFDKDTTNRIY